ncbi:nucleoside hydrolase [Clostridium sp. JNZ X4-2]
MYNIIYDCDNTMGIYGRDVDDGLAMLYLLGREDVNLLGICTTSGNADVEEVYENTNKMLKRLDISGVPILKGKDPRVSRRSQASSFMVKMVKKRPGDITILATGAMTNLYGAYMEDKNFFKNVKEIVIMGGILKPVIINNREICELNLSKDAEASFILLNSEVNMTILNAHVTAKAIFGEKEMDILKKQNSNKIFDFIYNNIKDWFDLNYSRFKIKGFSNWDAAAALYITNPELFSNRKMFLKSTLEDLKGGYMRETHEANLGNKVNMPYDIIDVEKFNSVLLDGLKKCCTNN